MDSVPARDLRNDVSGVLRRVESGEPVVVTVSGRPVAELRPLDRRPRAWTWREFELLVKPADAALTADLHDLAPDTTDDLPAL